MIRNVHKVDFPKGSYTSFTSALFQGLFLSINRERVFYIEQYIATQNTWCKTGFMDVLWSVMDA